MFRRSSRRSSGGSSPTGAIIGGAIYGVARAPISNMAAPLTGMIPGGAYADEIAMGLISWFAAKKGSGIVRQAGLAGLTIESARVSEQLTSGMLGFSGGSSGSQGTPQSGNLG